MTDEKVNIVEIVTVSKMTPIYKNGEAANAIEVINFNFENGDECGYNVIAQKGLYEIGSKACYIQPDYCLSPDVSLFESFTAPGGNPKKSRLGKMNRIRAIKFNFSFEGSTDPIYSFGILMPFDEVKSYLNYPDEMMGNADLAEDLSVTKYVEPEKAGSGMTKGSFPSFMYKTDETNIMNAVSSVKKAIQAGETFGITLKHDGSSHTTYIKKIDAVLTPGVCSRGMEKSMEQQYTNSYIDTDGNVFKRYLHPDTKVKGWYNHDVELFLTQEEIDATDYKQETTEVHDSWVDLAVNTGLIENGIKYCEDNELELAFRGEIYGSGLKGSGNKLNPDAGEKQTLRLFGIDNLAEGFATRLHYGNVHNLATVAKALNMQYTEPMVFKPGTYAELCEFCDNVFKEEKAKGRVIEGVVIRTHFSNMISVKYMNPEYDAKK